MNWSNFGDFVHMGGYGLYVWGSFGMCALVFAGEWLQLRARRRALRDIAFDAGDGLSNEAGA
jgi:heme exporter protein D